MEKSGSAVLNHILSRRSIRTFSERELEREKLEEIIESARWAPSDSNSQCWHFYVITNKKLLYQIKSIAKSSIMEIDSILDGKIKGCTKESEISLYKKVKLVLKHFEKYATGPLSDAKGLIVCASKLYNSKFYDNLFKHLIEIKNSNISTFNFRMEESIKSTSMAAQNILLTAHSLGIGAVPLTSPGYFGGSKIKELLGIPVEDNLTLFIAMGYPKTTIYKGFRKPVNEITSWYE